MIQKVSIICLLCAAHLVFAARDDAAGFYRQEKCEFSALYQPFHDLMAVDPLVIFVKNPDLQLYKVVRIPNYVCSNSGGGFCTNE